MHHLDRLQAMKTILYQKRKWSRRSVGWVSTMDIQWLHMSKRLHMNQQRQHDVESLYQQQCYKRHRYTMNNDDGANQLFVLLVNVQCLSIIQSIWVIDSLEQFIERERGANNTIILKWFIFRNTNTYLLYYIKICTSAAWSDCSFFSPRFIWNKC